MRVLLDRTCSNVARTRFGCLSQHIYLRLDQYFRNPTVHKLLAEDRFAQCSSPSSLPRTAQIFKIDMKFLLGIALAVLFVELVKGACDNVREIDGCSIPGDLPFPYKEAFKPACNRHDVCYSCGSGRGLNQRRCDNAFLTAMTKICAKRILDLPDCLVVAMVYYGAVSVKGSSSYENTPLSFCKQSWVPSCLP